MKEIKLPHKFDFRYYQEEQFIASQEGIKRFIKVWHRRAGKDVTDINFTIMKMVERVGNYWHLLPEYGQARKAIWEGKNKDGIPYMDYFPPELIKRKLDNRMMIEFVNGSIWQIVGSDNINSAIGAGPVGVVVSEFSLTDPQAWPLIEPMLLENDGWASFNLTPRGKNSAYKLWTLARKNPKWFTQLLTIDDTKDKNGKPIVNKEMIEELLAMGTDQETIDQEYFCSFEGSLQGSYYGAKFRQIAHHITRVPHLADYPVYTHWDIGRSDYTSIWFYQIVNFEFRVIDYYQTCGQDPDIIAGDLIKMKDDDDRPYRYEEHRLPHDAGHVRMGMGGKSVQQQFKQLLPSHKFIVQKKTDSVNADIMATRMFLNKCFFDEIRCEIGLEGLKGYTKKWNEAKKMYDDEPHHNWASHPADAFRELAIFNMDKYEIPRPSSDALGLPTINNLIDQASQNHRTNRRI